MAVPFRRTLASLHSDRGRDATLALLIGVATLAAWGVWFALARLPVYAVSDGARVETAVRPHAVMPAVAGLVLESPMQIGRRVEKGEPLVIMDTAEARARLAEADAARERASGREKTLAVELEALRRAGTAEIRALEAGVAAARSEADAADVRARQKAEQAERAAELSESGSMPTAEVEMAISEAAASEADARALASRADARQREVVRSAAQHALEVARLERELEDARGQSRMAATTAARSQHDVERRTVRAPLDGRIAEAKPIAPGTFVQAGERLALIMPADTLRVLAYLPPDELGRVHPGQPARLRLDAFPWTEYGTVPLVVERVASDLDTEGRVSVELRILGPLPRPGLHAATGSVEIETEVVRPYQLVLRAAGLAGVRR